MIFKINCKEATLRQLPDGSCEIEYVPIHKEPNTIADNIKAGAYDDWSRRGHPADRIKPEVKKPPERLVNGLIIADGNPTFPLGRNIYLFKEPVLVTEVPKGYKLVSRDQVLRAFFKGFNGPEIHMGGHTSTDAFLKELGFDNE